MKRSLVALLLAGVALVTVLLVRAWPRPPQARPESVSPVPLDSMAIAHHLAEAIRIPTITDDRPMRTRAAPFVAFHAFLARTYPRVHAELTREVIAEHSLLFRWDGTNAALQPILLMGHLDVVPVAAGSEARWTHAPFSGAIANGSVWGRGALDDKQHVIGILEAVEALLAQGFAPARTTYLFFGHDEEGLGSGGARQAAALLTQRNVRLEYVLDEGGVIVENVIGGVDGAVALVRTAEKGYLTLRLSVAGTGGHSSAPPRETAIGILARAITALEANRFKPRLTRPMEGLLQATASEQSLPARMVLRNLWLFKPLVLRQLARQPSTDASIRTTIAPTMLEGGPKDNVLPTVARAVVNFRILPGETSQSVIHHVRRAIDDARVDIAIVSASEPPRASSTNSAAFQLLRTTIRQISPDVLVAPFLLGGATDARHFESLSDNVFGFSMARGGNELTELAHGTNERIAVGDLANGVRFYMQLLRNSR